MASVKALAFAAALATFGLGAALSAPLVDKPTAQPFWVEEVVSGLNVPWSMVWLPNGDMLILEKFGGLRMIKGGKLLPEVLPGAPKAYKAGPNGLLDLALDPDFQTNHRVFITFDDGNEITSRPSLYRARFTGKGLVNGEVIFRQTPEATVAPYPSLGRILFLPDKTMLVGSAADDPRRNLAQRLDTDLGKILRLDRDGRAPRDNPFVGQPGARPEIYAYGVRNPIGLFRDPKTGTIWETENAMRGGDELNILKPGANYGWPVATYGVQYSGEKLSDTPEMPGVESPITYWVPSIAPSGAAVATDRYPGWKGDVFTGALSGQHLRHVVIRNNKAVAEEKLLTELEERIRDIRPGPDGYLYVLTDNANGRLLRLRPGAPSPKQLAMVAHKLPVKSNPTVDTLDLKPKPADAAHGQQLFAQRCGACHSVNPAAPSGVGPNLNGVVGRLSAQIGFAYSPAMKAANLKWDAENIDHFLAGPKAYIPNTIMAAPPLPVAQDRRDIIAYLKSQNAPVKPAG